MALFIAPKSPRWLFSNNKTEEGKEVSTSFNKCLQSLLFKVILDHIAYTDSLAARNFIM